jgi:hypothetical protein
MPLSIDGGCPSCIREAFYVFISVFDRLSKDPHVTEETPEIDGAGKADGVQIGIDPAKPGGDKSVIASSDELTPAQEDELLALLGIDPKDVTPQDYLNRIGAYIEGLPEPSPALLKKKEELEAVVASLPPVTVKHVPNENPVTTDDTIPGHIPMNTQASLTPAQKAAQTRAANAAKKAVTGK